jgi:hypothetical protein
VGTHELNLGKDRIPRKEYAKMSAQTMFREDELVVRRQKVNGEWIEMPYPKLGGRLRVLHEQHSTVSINTEIVQMTPDFVVVRATTQTDRGTYSGTGTASAQRDARLADALVELAESRSIARSARFAGVGVEYCGAEEVSHISDSPEERPTMNKPSEEATRGGNGNGKRDSSPPNRGNGKATQAQVRALHALSRKAQYHDEDITGMLAPFDVSRFDDLPKEAASQLIGYMQQEVAS